MTTVLIVDDSAVDRRLAGKLLEKSGELSIQYAVDGADALERIAAAPPDVVVTDLQMPVLNGLELVEQVRRKFPLVPVILMTAHGSEAVAVQALMSGAASYVPKTELPRHLAATVQNVLCLARSSRQQKQLLDCVRERRVRYVLPNDSSLIPPLVDQLQQWIAAVGLVDDTARVQMAIALEEALLNSLYHGNLEMNADQLEELRSSLLCPQGGNPLLERSQKEPYRDRKIHVDVAISRESARFVIRDDGPGFDPTQVPDPADPANLTRSSGRGLVLMRMFMDEVQRNPNGNEVCLIKRREPDRVPQLALGGQTDVLQST
ncbi:MAG TPA: response regulator [Pirellulales bacterium]